MYNPGVTDISGQIRAQGRISQAQGIAQGISGGYQEYAQNKARNAAISGANEGLIRAFMQDDETKKYAPEGIDQFIEKAVKGGGLSLNDSMKLNGMLTTALATKGHIQDQKLKAQEGQMRQQQILSSQNAIAQSQKDQAAIADALKQFLPPSEGEESPKFDPIRFLQGATQAGASPQALDRIDSIIKMAGPQKTMGIKVGTVHDRDANGKPIIRTIDQNTGETLGEGPPTRAYADPEEAAAIKLAESDATNMSNSASALINGVADKHEVAQATLPQIKEIERLYASGVESGFGQDFMTQAGSFGRRLGLVDDKTQADREVLQKALANTALANAQEMMKGQGAVSEYERRLINQASAEIGKSPQANLRIIRYTKAISERAIDMEEKRQELLDDGKKPTEIAEQLRRFRSANPLSKYMEKEVSPDVKATNPAKSAAATGSSIDDIVNKWK